MRYRGNVRRLCTTIASRMIVTLLLVAAPVEYVIVRIATVFAVFAVFAGPDGPSQFYRQRHCTHCQTQTTIEQLNDD